MSADDEFGEDLESLLSGSTTPPKTTKKTAGRPAPEVPPVIPAAPAFSADDLARLKEELRAEMRAELQGGITVNVAAPDPRRTPALDLSAQVVPKEAEPGTGHLVHFIDDGFTVAGRVFYRGEEFRAPETDDWATLTSNQQIARYGQLYFRPGPWDGDTYDLNDPALTEDDRAKLLEIVRKQQAASTPV